MDIQATVLTKDSLGRVFFTADADDVDTIYLNRLEFWTDRHGAMAAAEVRDLAIAGQGENYNHGMKRPLGATLEELYRATQPEGFLSILELGGADGITLRHLQTIFPDFRVRYTGIEPCAVFVDNLKKHFPRANAMVGDAEKFIAMPDEEFPDRPYRAFVASLSLCMIKPVVVRKILARVAQLCDEALIIDYLGNVNGEISPTQPVMFQFGEHRRIVFAHAFKDHALAAGFCNVTTSEEPNLAGEHPSWGLIRASK